MTGPRTDLATFEPGARPARRLVAAIAAVALVCVGLWWSGAVGPRVRAVLVAVDADAAVGRGTLHVEVRNHGWLAVEVGRVTVDDRRGAPVVLHQGGPGGPGTTRLAPGAVLRLEASYEADCRRPTGYGADPGLGVRVRAPLGATQTRQVSTFAVYRARTGGNDMLDPGPLLCPFDAARS